MATLIVAALAAATAPVAARPTPSVSTAAQSTAARTSAAASVRSEGPCTDRLCYPRNLEPFFLRLAEARRASGRPIHVMQIGDSHTAGDMITNGWRTAFQARYGFGGRGVLAAGRPYNGIITFGVTHSMSPGWTINANFGKSWNSAGAPIGIAGFSATARGSGERLGVTTDTPDQDFDRVTVCAVRRPGGGSVQIRLGSQVERLDLSADEVGGVCRSLDNPWRVSSAELVTETSGPVTITSLATFSRAGGVALSNLGVTGSQLVHLNRESDRIVAAEFEAYRPDLIVLAFGTNEGFSQSLSVGQFESDLRAQVRRIRRLAGADVPILLLGAPDANTSNIAIAGNYGQPRACPGSDGNGSWYTPTLLGAIREQQRRIAREMGLAFWDWSQAMGGMCSAMRWRNADPPLMRGDHVHFTRAGGGRIGLMLFEDVDAAFAATRSRR